MKGHIARDSRVEVDTGVVRPNGLLIQRTPLAHLCLCLDRTPPHPSRLDKRGRDPSDILAVCRQLAAIIEDKRAVQGLLPARKDAGSFRPSSLNKASPDDPKHPGWPAGTPGGLGGKYRSKTDTERNLETVRRLAARRETRIALVATLLVLAAAALTLVPGAGEAADLALLADLAEKAAEFRQLKIDTDAAVEFVKNGPYTLDELRVSEQSESFSSYGEFYKDASITDPLEKRYGSAGAGYEYHHIVTQGGANAENIPQEQLQSTDNIVRIPTLLHEAIHAIYNEKYVDENGKKTDMTVYEWLQKQPFEVQRAKGIEIMREVGVVVGE